MTNFPDHSITRSKTFHSASNISRLIRSLSESDLVTLIVQARCHRHTDAGHPVKSFIGLALRSMVTGPRLRFKSESRSVWVAQFGQFDSGP